MLQVWARTFPSWARKNPNRFLLKQSRQWDFILFSEVCSSLIILNRVWVLTVLNRRGCGEPVCSGLGVNFGVLVIFFV